MQSGLYKNTNNEIRVYEVVGHTSTSKLITNSFFFVTGEIAIVFPWARYYRVILEEKLLWIKNLDDEEIILVKT